MCKCDTALKAMVQGPVFGRVSMQDATGAYLCLRLLPPRCWWRQRGVSAQLRDILDGANGCKGLLEMLVESLGPLRTVNDEINFAGCVYTAIHHRSTGPLHQFLRPLCFNGWARNCFAVAVVREALVQAAIAGDAASCKVLLSAHGPDAKPPSPCFGYVFSHKRLGKSDAVRALEAAEEWDSMAPEAASPQRREEVCLLLKALC
eukprot:TRINITY_DN42784_c0_g1_i1.p1 TRINITY_DN42784_c0_g1~~TRINITY_DN42784_c0_g1_i1.p1  ORF type:complete len:204 (+),score=20.93 TRINITY_DN42784_c0_g1_i1:112-723(+)